MIGVAASAPGKLLLCGEYAVLRDAPAVLMAVDRRAIVRTSANDEPWYSMTTPGFSDRTYRFELQNGNRLKWLEDSADSALALPAAVIALTGIRVETPRHIEIDTRDFIDATGTKFGLGSSAAAAAALTRALLGSDADRTTVWATARRAHERVHGGSGADVAASCFGGLLIYRRDESAAPEPLDWPDDLTFRVYFSGRAASTRNAIDGVGSANVPDTAWQSLAAAAAAAARAWQDGDAHTILDAVRDYRDELRAFDRNGVDTIFSAGHDKLAEIGDSIGVVYKPSGAGGGDCGVALADDIGRLDRFDEAAAIQGFVTLDVQRDNTGA